MKNAIILKAALAGGALLTFLGAPALAADPAPVPVFSATEVAWAKGYAPNILDGVAAMPAGKDAKTCAGEEVVLRPTSALEVHRNRIVFGNLDGARIPAQRYFSPPGATEANMPAPPREYDASARKGRCSIDGKFLFAGIPDGEYYVVTLIFPSHLLSKVVEMDDIEVLMKRVAVSGGAMVKVDLFAGV